MKYCKDKESSDEESTDEESTDEESSNNKKTIKINKFLYNKLKKELDEKNKRIKELTKEIDILKDKLEEKNIEIEKLKPKKGSNCSKSGKEYENRVYNICKNCYIDGKLFNTQKKEDLGSCSSKIDILCNYEGKKNIGIEIKKCNAQDWNQCILECDENGTWKVSKNSKSPKSCQKIFNKLIKNIDLFEGTNLPVGLTHEEWKDVKKSSDKWKDTYYPIPEDTISKLYKNKGCSYIQLSDGYGLYHLGEDICKFNVPKFETEERLRIRVKIHKTADKNGICKTSVTAACQPVKISNVNKSEYSLDNIKKLPKKIDCELES